MAQHFELIVPPENGGTRLDSYLTAALGRAGLFDDGPIAAPSLSRARLQALIASGEVTINGAVQRASQKVRAGQAVVLALPDAAPATVAAVPMELQVLYEDGHLLVLNKPAHLVVHPGAGTQEPTLVHGLLAHCQDLSGIGGVLRPGIVHRLDRGTSGVMVVAKNDQSHRHLAAQFAARTVQKGYFALVWRGAALAGQGAQEVGATQLIDTPYGRDPKHRRRMTGLLDESTPRRARTKWRLVAQNDTLALLAVTLLTGRTHQIRVHLSELGLPIVGDGLYGQGHRGLPPGCPGLDHQALHAAYLAFEHPVTHERVHYRAPIPASWHDVAHSLPQAPEAATTRNSPCLD